MIERALQIVAPHPCSGCGKTGTLLCDDCKYDIITEPFCGCILCALPHEDGICADHQMAFSQVFVVGVRTGTLRRLIDVLKFHNTKAAAKALALLLHERLPVLPADTRIVPVPTVASHVRQRGYDQVDLIARELASLRGLTVQRLLVRRTNTTQHTSSRSERRDQAAQAFWLDEGVSSTSDSPILLLDDVITTGATVQEATRLLAGTNATILVAALAYQALD